jgi:folylpolyglutamate synthase
MWKKHHPEASTHVVSSLEEAVETARACSDAHAGRPVYIIATGSLRMIGGLLTVLEGETIATETLTSIG